VIHKLRNPASGTPVAARPVRVGWLRPTLPGRGLPTPESPARRFAIRAIALVALAASAVYLAWRITSTINLDVWWLAVPLVVLEIHAALGLGLFTFSLWDVDAAPRVSARTSTDQKIAVLVPTYNEGLEILMPTIAAAVAMRIAHETWVLDDGDRPEVARLADDLGARYLARPTHEHAKAGNLNHALGIVEADLVAILDADHVAAPDFLVHTLGYFDDPKVALVQTPQEFYNLESFEHAPTGTSPAVEPATDEERGRYHEQVLFYRILQPGKNRWGGAFWCGTGAVVRTAALREVGGVATDTITEDIHTTIRLHRRGWRTVYHNEVLARGLAASDAETYQLQRHRWGTGAMQVLRKENPLFVPGLRLGQRLAYAATLLGWFDAWRTLGYLILPIAVVATGGVPITADAATFTFAFGTTFILQQVALRVLSRGGHRPLLGTIFEFVRMTPNLLATLTLVTRRTITFRVTPKGRVGDGRRAVRVPPLLTTMAVLMGLATVWFGLTLVGETPLRYAVPWAIVASFGWMVLNAGFVALAVRRVRSLRYAPERRTSVRFETQLRGRLDGIPVTVTDLSLSGARLITFAPLERDVAGELAVEFPVLDISLRGVVRSSRSTSTGEAITGLEFLPGQHGERALLALALFGSLADPNEDVVVPAGRLPQAARRAVDTGAVQAA